MRALLMTLLFLTGCSARMAADESPLPADAAAATVPPAPDPANGTRGDDVHAAAQTVASIPAQPRANTTLPAPGTISGKILYPTDATPAMRICAIHDGGDLYGCMHTEAGATSYRIERLPPTGYRVIAKPQSGLLHVGGFVQPVRCIAEPCPALLVPVNVAPGENVTGADLNGFYAVRSDFPALPGNAD